ncbi:uncharacterized protein BDV17DRAFT_257990 [Aspergillus undulatus]|uniref:uncharacterized protein n=1 Tax=Aspergillus undulatus TaxID=1810928 RepID=UPI003CCD259E
MEPYQSSRECMLCSGGIYQPEWTKRFITVLVRDKHIEQSGLYPLPLLPLSMPFLSMHHVIACCASF